MFATDSSWMTWIHTNLGTLKLITVFIQLKKNNWHDVYRNTIASSSPGERIFNYFEKIRFASQKIEFLNLCF